MAGSHVNENALLLMAGHLYYFDFIGRQKTDLTYINENSKHEVISFHIQSFEAAR